MNNSFSTFGLTLEQTQVLFSLQRMIIAEDVEISTPAHYRQRSKTSDNVYERIDNSIIGDALKGRKIPFIKKSEELEQDLHEMQMKKNQWFDIWTRSIGDYLRGLNNGVGVPLLLTTSELQQAINNIDSKTDNSIWKYLVLFECSIFHPYYPINKDDAEKKIYEKCKFYKNDSINVLSVISKMLGIENGYVSKFRNDYEVSYRRLSGFWTKVAASAGIGMAVVFGFIIIFQPYMIFAAPGLTGAAAFSSALAAMGGGAIAAGGLGMAGGMAVLIGGGALLGIGAGGGAGAYAAKMSADMTLLESAKIEVVLKDIVLAVQKDTKQFQRILIDVTKQQQQLREQVINLQVEGEKNKEQIKELEKKIGLLEKLVVGSREYSCFDKKSA